jgi:hypothetical protein
MLRVYVLRAANKTRKPRRWQYSFFGTAGFSKAGWRKSVDGGALRIGRKSRKLSFPPLVGAGLPANVKNAALCRDAATLAMGTAFFVIKKNLD